MQEIQTQSAQAGSEARDSGVTKNRSSEVDMSFGRRAGVLGGALLLVALTLWQVRAKRDDWPLSNFNLYSFIAGKTATRSVIVGFSPEGEVPFSRSDLRLASSPEFALARIQRNPRRMKLFMDQVRSAYAAKRTQASGGIGDNLPEVLALRIFQERWRLQSQMKGAERPTRKLVRSLYLPSDRLTKRVKLEAAGKASVLELGVPANTDRVLEAEDATLSGAASILPDKYASGSAVLLKARKKSSGQVTFDFESKDAQLSLLMRLRTKSSKDPGIVSIELDGKIPRELRSGAGNFGRYYKGGWVWSSREMAEPVVRLKLGGKTTMDDKSSRKAQRHHLTVRAKKGEVVIDQIWLSTEVLELPVDNRALAPERSKREPQR